MKMDLSSRRSHQIYITQVLLQIHPLLECWKLQNKISIHRWTKQLGSQMGMNAPLHSYCAILQKFHMQSQNAPRIQWFHRICHNLFQTLYLTITKQPQSHWKSPSTSSQHHIRVLKLIFNSPSRIEAEDETKKIVEGSKIVYLVLYCLHTQLTCSSKDCIKKQLLAAW